MQNKQTIYLAGCIDFRKGMALHDAQGQTHTATQLPPASPLQVGGSATTNGFESQPDYIRGSMRNHFRYK